jgi:hypothetical protein
MSDERDEVGGGLLSRWSRRKAEARSGVPPAEPPAAVPAAPPALVASPPVVAPLSEAPAPPPLPTLADVAALGPDADYARFVLSGVDEGVKQAAMKKLFAEPHFNVMDGLDTYIDDYGLADPVPEAMLRRMTQSRLLGLFDAVPAEPAEAPDGAAVLPLPQSSPDPDVRLAHATDEDPAVRLQPDDDADSAGAGAISPVPRS